jgi:hypothetical protein
MTIWTRRSGPSLHRPTIPFTSFDFDLFDLHSVIDLGKEDLTQLLLFHVVSDDLKYRDIECGQ